MDIEHFSHTLNFSALKKGNVILLSRDGERVEAPSTLAWLSPLVVAMFSDLGLNYEDELLEIPLKDFSEESLRRLIKWFNVIFADSTPLEKQRKADLEVSLDLNDPDAFWDLMRLADFLQLEPLLKLLCAHLTAVIEKCRRDSDLRRLFDLHEDSREEENRALFESLVDSSIKLNSL